MSWQQPNIGSRVTREGHARFWERPEVKFLRATRQTRTSSLGAARPLQPSADIGPGGQSVGQTAQFCLGSPVVLRGRGLGALFGVGCPPRSVLTPVRAPRREEEWFPR